LSNSAAAPDPLPFLVGNCLPEAGRGTHASRQILPDPIRSGALGCSATGSNDCLCCALVSAPSCPDLLLRIWRHAPVCRSFDARAIPARYARCAGKERHWLGNVGVSGQFRPGYEGKQHNDTGPAGAHGSRSPRTETLREITGCGFIESMMGGRNQARNGECHKSVIVLGSERIKAWIP
jgi:hypothetical protein